jgi:hypothetical protein
MRRNSALVVLVAVAVLLAIPCLVVSAQTDNKGELFTAFAASLGTGKTALIQIRVTRWSSDEERQKLLDVLIEKGQDGLLGALQKIRPPCGSIRNVNRVGWDLFYARQAPTPDGGRKIVLATDRRVAFREAVNNTRSMQYQFTLVELHVDKDGKGEGKLVPAAKVSWDAKDKRIEIENYSALPVDLLNVQAKPL